MNKFRQQKIAMWMVDLKHIIKGLTYFNVVTKLASNPCETYMFLTLTLDDSLNPRSG